MKIYANKEQTKNGGELHIDATGHFMKRFRNVLFKQSREFSELEPEFDRVELQVIEDAYLDLSFLSNSESTGEFKVVLADSYAMGLEQKALSTFEVTDIEGDKKEDVMSYKLQKGKHYSLTIYYIGGIDLDEHGKEICQTYDLSMAISHAHELMQQTRCTDKDESLSFTKGLPKSI
jgi:uncharacterized protein YueI